MPFTLISGTFHLVGQTPAGGPSGFEPDGDSIQFRPTSPKLLHRLERVGAAYRLTSIGSTQLRFEGIDALELHFEGLHQPRPLADQARDFLTGQLGLNPVPYRPPEGVRVQPPVSRDATPGFILSRSLEVHGRPVSFAYTGAAPMPAGSEVFLTPQLLRRSLNYKSVRSGNAYPLFYDTLFKDLRSTLARAAAAARREQRGIWTGDTTTAGLRVTDRDGLEQNAVVFPKLFRRLADYLKSHAGLAQFLAWLAESKEQVLDLTSANFTHLDNLLTVVGDRVALTVRPEQIVFISAKTPSTAVAPWLKH